MLTKTDRDLWRKHFTETNADAAWQIMIECLDDLDAKDAAIAALKAEADDWHNLNATSLERIAELEKELKDAEHRAGYDGEMASQMLARGLQLTKAEAALREIADMWEGWKRDPDDRDLRRWIHDWIERHRAYFAAKKP